MPAIPIERWQPVAPPVRTGAGHSGLALLASFQPDIVKLDMHLIRGIDHDPARRTIVRHTLRMLEELSITAVCEGVETEGELAALRDLGVGLVQGYVIARPVLEGLAGVGRGSLGNCVESP